MTFVSTCSGIGVTARTIVLLWKEIVSEEHDKRNMPVADLDVIHSVDDD